MFALNAEYLQGYPKMATTKDASKGIECPKFSGKEEDYQVRVTKFGIFHGQRFLQDNGWNRSSGALRTS